MHDLTQDFAPDFTHVIWRVILQVISHTWSDAWFRCCTCTAVNFAHFPFRTSAGRTRRVPRPQLGRRGVASLCWRTNPGWMLSGETIDIYVRNRWWMLSGETICRHMCKKSMESALYLESVRPIKGCPVKFCRFDFSYLNKHLQILLSMWFRWKCI
jgi:hypothetical protein